MSFDGRIVEIIIILLSSRALSKISPESDSQADQVCLPRSVSDQVLPGKFIELFDWYF